MVEAKDEIKTILIMGIDGGHSLTFRLCNLNFGQLVAIARYRHGDSDDAPRICIDSSWIARRFNGRAGGPILAIIQIATCFTQVGFEVSIVCDGAQRHASKRISVKRQSEREVARINSHMKRAELISKKTSLHVATCSSDKLLLRKEVDTLAKELEKAETAQAKFYSVGQDFYEELKEKVASTILSGTVGGGRIRVLQSFFQADTTIARACVQHKCEIAFMNDSDLAAHAGKWCIGITDFKLVKGAKKGVFTIDKASIFSASKETIGNICKHAIHFKALEKTKTAGEKQHDPYVINAVHPLFDVVDDPKTRALLAVAVGCDVFPGGVFGLGAIRIMAAADQQQCDDGQLYYNRMLEHFAKAHQKNKLPNAKLDDVKAMLSAYVDAFLFEPANALEEYEGDDDENDHDNNVPQYVSDVPTGLPMFIKSFALKSHTIINYRGPTFRVCKGVGCGEHEFLEIDGYHNCKVCKEDSVFCRFCIFENPKHDTAGSITTDDINCRDCCFGCYSEILVGLPGDTDTSNFKSKEEMKNTLIKAGIDIPNDMPLDEIEDIYDALIDTDGGLVYDESIRAKIPLPLRESSFLNRIPRLTSEFLFQNGANFLQDPNLSKRHVIQLTYLLSLLVTYPVTLSKAKTEATVLPQLIQDSAAQSRLHSGFRLLKRAICHTIDPRTPPFITAKGNIVEYNGEVGILICHRIRASMKQDIYPTRQIFTSKGIICCECECKVGSKKEERIVCVHILPSQLMLSLLLHGGLAQHALYAIGALWKCADNVTTRNSAPITNDDTAMMISAIRNLELCASNISNNIGGDKGPVTINECLVKYSVGTDNVKFSPPPPRDLSRVGPLRDMIRKSPVGQIAAIVKKQNVESSSTQQEGICDSFRKTLPDYNRIWRGLRALDDHMPSKKKNSSRKEFIGFELIRLRKTCADDAFSASEHCLLQSAIAVANEIMSPQEMKNAISKNTKASTNNKAKNNPKQQAKNATIEQTSGTHAQPPRHKCVMGCSTINSSYPFHNIPPPQNDLKTPNTDAKRKEIAIKKFHRKVYLKRCGLNEGDNRRLRLCDRHRREEEEFVIDWYNMEGQQQTTKAFLDVLVRLEEGRSITRAGAATRKRPLEKKFETQKRSRHILETEKVKKKHNRSCSFVGCSNTASANIEGITFHRVPIIPKFHESSDRYRADYFAKIFHRREVLGRMSIPRNNKDTDLRICSEHSIESIRQTISWETT